MNAQSEFETLAMTIDTGKTGMRQLLTMLRALMPVLDNIKNAVENSSSKIPKATEQLSTVTQATESATMEILNLLDDISRRIDLVLSSMQSAGNDLARKQEAAAVLSVLVSQFPPEQRRALTEAPEWTVLTDLAPPAAALTQSRTDLQEISAVSMNIAMALQVQDITSQQIESVRHQIESVRMQLSHVVGQYEGKIDDDVPVVPIKRPFDEEASYTKDESRQADADDIIAQFARQAVVANNH
ncbi:MAG: protein phosphatase CheZ [Bacteroidetes bacterium]|nr:protein phosphatase CheZ [Bacteroidota bacterium]